MSIGEALAVFALTGFASTAQVVTGFGFGLLIIPPLVLLLGPRDAVVLSTVLGTGVSALMAVRLHDVIEWRLVTLLVVAALAGTPVGLAILFGLDRNVLQIAIAVAVLAATAVLSRGIRVPVESRIGPAVAGFSAGVARMAAGLPGPPVVLYLQASGFQPNIQRGVTTAFFVATGVVGAAIFAVQGSLDLSLAALSLPAMPGILLGWWAGEHIFRRIDARVFAVVVQAMLVGSALLALAGALF